MKRRILLATLLLMALCAWAMAEPAIQGRRLTLTLPEGWRDVSDIAGVDGSALMRDDGSLLLVVSTDLEKEFGPDMPSLFKDREIAMPMLKELLQSLLDSYHSDSKIVEIPLADGILCCMANADVDGSPGSFAIVQCGSDLWYLTCTSTTTDAAEGYLRDVLSAIRVYSGADAAEPAPTTAPDAGGESPDDGRESPDDGGNAAFPDIPLPVPDITPDIAPDTRETYKV